MNMHKKLNYIALVLITVALLSGATLSATERITSDSVDNLSVFIHNSDGNVWEATASNLQLAIYDLNSTDGGTVTIPVGTINTITPIKLTNNTWLRGQGVLSILRCDDSVEIDVIQNQHWGAGGDPTDIIDSNIRISDLHIDGNNGNGQWTWDFGSGHQQNMDCGISIAGANNVTIENVYVNNSFEAGIHIMYSNNSIIRDCVIWNSGSQIDNGSTGSSDGGIFVADVFNMIIDGNICHDYYADGIVVETYGQSGTAFLPDWGRSSGVLITNNICYNGHNGIWVETASNTTVSDNICHDLYWTGAYTSNASGIMVGSNSNNFVMDNQVYTVSNHPTADGIARGIRVTTGGTNYYPYSTVSGNSIRDIEGDGLSCYIGTNVNNTSFNINNNIIVNVSESGIEASSAPNYNSSYSIRDNVVSDCYRGIFCKGSGVNFTTIVESNTVEDCGSAGIYHNPSGGSEKYAFVTNNVVKNTTSYGIFTNAPASGGELSVIKDNIVINTGNHGMGTDSDWDNVIITGNVLEYAGGNIISCANTNKIVKDNIGYDLDDNEIIGEISIQGNDVAMPLPRQGQYHNVTEGVSDGNSNGFTYATGNLTCTRAGLYIVIISASVSGTNNKEYHIALGVNAVRDTNIHTQLKMSASGDDVPIGASGTVTLAVGDKVNLMVENVDGTEEFTIHDMNLMLWKFMN